MGKSKPSRGNTGIPNCAALLILCAVAACTPADEEIVAAKREGRVLDLDVLRPGHYDTVATRYIVYFAIRDLDSTLRVFAVSHSDNTYRLASSDTAIPYSCRSFGPDASGKVLDTDGRLRCRDTKLSNRHTDKLVFEFDGRSRSEDVADLREVPYRIDGNTVYVIDTEAPVTRRRQPNRVVDGIEAWFVSSFSFETQVGIVATILYAIAGSAILFLWRALISQSRLLSWRRYAGLLVVCSLAATGVMFVTFYAASAGPSAPALAYIVIFVSSLVVGGIAGLLLLLVGGWFLAVPRTPAAENS